MIQYYKIFIFNVVVLVSHTKVLYKWRLTEFEGWYVRNKSSNIDINVFIFAKMRRLTKIAVAVP